MLSLINVFMEKSMKDIATFDVTGTPLIYQKKQLFFRSILWLIKIKWTKMGDLIAGRPSASQSNVFF